MSTTTLYLIRHGQTDWNLAGKIQGHADIPLNATGKAQAQKVAQFLKKKHVSLHALYSSDLQRAHQTAHAIATLFTLEIISAADLREGHYGKMEGLTKKEWHDLYGHFDWLTLPEEIGAEPRDKVIERVMNYLLLIAQKHKDQRIAVVTHGGAIRSLLVHLGHNVEQLPEVTNESIITFTWHEDRQMFAFESIEHAE
jgi:broad specificity phosphatase PhoE